MIKRDSWQLVLLLINMAFLNFYHTHTRTQILWTCVCVRVCVYVCVRVFYFTTDFIFVFINRTIFVIKFLRLICIVWNKKKNNIEQKNVGVGVNVHVCIMCINIKVYIYICIYACIYITCIFTKRIND